MYFVLRMRSKGGPQYPRKETITAFSGSQPGPLFFCRIGEFISLRIVLWTTATTIAWVQLNQNTTSTFQLIRKFSCLQSLWLTLTFASKKYFKLKDASCIVLIGVFDKTICSRLSPFIGKIGTNICLTCEYVSNFWGLKYCKSRDTRSKPKTRQYIWNGRNVPCEGG